MGRSRILLFLGANILAHQFVWPQISTIQPNPQIPPMLDSISTLMIRSYLDSLVSFNRRHTMDDTSSQTGIGAARRWIYRKFLEFSTASGGRLEVRYFNFNATICGINRLHRNVMAILPGTLTPNRYLIVSGHYDSRGHPSNNCSFNIAAPGANDDASGTAVTIELARVMSRYQFDASIIFMATTGEDVGLYGSEAYASYAQTNGIRIDGMITNDIVGNVRGSNGIVDSSSVRHFSSVAETTHHRQLSRYMKLKTDSYYPTMTVTLIPNVDRPGRGGDHMSFQNHGYAGVRFIEPNENTAYQHNASDIIANMSPAYSARVARVNAAGLASLAWGPQRPTPPTVTNTGTGNSLLVQWPATNTEPDLAGYRIAVRDSGRLFYNSIVDAGNVQQYIVTGLTEGIPVYVGVSAYDTDGNESVFSQERLKRPFYDAALPIQLGSLSAFQSGPTSVRVDWLTLSELNTYGFYVQRRVSGVPFTDLPTGFIPGHGTTNVPHSYSFTDEWAAAGLWLYRLRVVDLDGSVSYTDDVQVEILTAAKEESEPNKFELGTNYPNPFNPTTEIPFRLAQAGNVSLVVRDVLGRHVVELARGLYSAGLHSVTWEASDQASGVYFASFTVTDNLGTTRFTGMNKLVLLK